MGDGRVINGLAVSVGGQELQAMGEALLHSQLEGVVDRICDREGNGGERSELRERQQELRFVHHFAAQGCGCGNQPEKWIGHLRVQVLNLSSVVVLDLRAQMVILSSSTKIELGSLLSYIIGVDEDSSSQLTLESKAPGLLVGGRIKKSRRTRDTLSNKGQPSQGGSGRQPGRGREWITQPPKGSCAIIMVSGNPVRDTVKALKTASTRTSCTADGNLVEETVPATHHCFFVQPVCKTKPWSKVVVVTTVVVAVIAIHKSQDPFQVRKLRNFQG